MNSPTTRPPFRGRVTPRNRCGVALFLLLFGCWAVAVPNPVWGIPAGLVALAVGLVLLAREERKETDRG